MTELTCVGKVLRNQHSGLGWTIIDQAEDFIYSLTLIFPERFSCRIQALVARMMSHPNSTIQKTDERPEDWQWHQESY